MIDSNYYIPSNYICVSLTDLTVNNGNAGKQITIMQVILIMDKANT